MGVEGAGFACSRQTPRAASRQAKGRELVADALFSLRAYSLDGIAKLLKRGPLPIAQGCEIRIRESWVLPATTASRLVSVFSVL